MSKNTNTVVVPSTVKSCPVTAEQFQSQATAIEVTINGVKLLADVKLFSTGSFGWYLSGKLTIKVGDKLVPVQCGMNLTCVGSKPV